MRARASVLAIIGVVCLAAAPAVFGTDSRTLKKTIPAAAIRTLELETGDGSVTVTAGSADEVVISVDVSPGRAERRGWLPAPRTGDPSKASISATTSSDRLVLRIDTAGDPLEARWTIAVPSRLAVDISARKSEVSVRGVAGGVRANADSSVSGHGRMEVDVPRGALQLTLGVGTIDARTRTSSYGDVEVRSTVGDAALSIDQHTVDSPREPGPGHHLAMRGVGADRLKVKVTVGDARLRIR